MFDSESSVFQAACNYRAVMFKDLRIGDNDYGSTGCTQHVAHFGTKAGKNAGADANFAALLRGSNAEFELLHKVPGLIHRRMISRATTRHSYEVAQYSLTHSLDKRWVV